MSDSQVVRNYSEIASSPMRKTLLSAVEYTFRNMDPAKVVEKFMQEHKETIIPNRKIYVLGFGKASLSMYRGLSNFAEPYIRKASIVIPEGMDTDYSSKELSLYRGTHPMVSEKSYAATKASLEGISEASPDDLLVTLISGGGSALFEYPEEWTSISEISDTADCLMSNGADISDLNTVRVLMSRVKGGKLLAFLRPERILNLLISDVPGDDPALIASGPLVYRDKDTSMIAGIEKKYSGNCHGLRNIAGRSGQKVSEDEIKRRVTTHVIQKNSDFVHTFMEYLSNSGFPTVSIGNGLGEDVSSFSEWLVDKVRSIYRNEGKPFWFVGGGETTSKIIGKGKGGRNCELALRVMQRFSRENFLFSSIGTDGMDGNSGAMGGISDTGLKERVGEEELMEYLSRSDSYSLLAKYNSAIISGFTGTNVSDIFIGYYGGIMKL